MSNLDQSRKAFLLELRKHFRNEFKKEDFCIGQEQVERVFRELLGEPEPVRESFLEGPAVTAAQLHEAMKDAFDKEKMKSIFERDSSFYDKITKKRN